MLLRRYCGFFIQAYLYTRALAALLHHGMTRGYAEPSWDWMLSYLILAFPVAILIHEFGHYLAGAALGWHFTRFAIGPFQLARTDGRLRIELITARQYGLVGFAPANFSQFPLQWSLLVVAGPLASFAGGVIFILLSERAPSADYFWICMCNAQWALLGIMQLIPFTAGGGGSDGFKLLQAIRGGPSMDAAEAATLIYASRLKPLRPRDWPRDLLLRLVAPQNETQAKAQARRLYFYLAYVHFLDAGEINLAGRYLDQLMAQWTPRDTPEFAFEAAYFRARYRNNPEGARNRLALEKRILKSQPWMRQRAQAAIECASNNDDQARPIVDQALSALNAARPSGANQYEIDQLQNLTVGGANRSPIAYSPVAAAPASVPSPISP